MDGTIADTSPGIFESFRHVAQVLNVNEPTDEELMKVIGGSLPSNLTRLFGLSEEETKNAVAVYRDYYAEYGIFNSKVYGGFFETVVKLKEKGYNLAVATMKSEVFAKKLMSVWNLNSMFTSVNGVDSEDSQTKSDLIKKAISESNSTTFETIMVGDSDQDLLAARECSVRFVAATYGFGLPKEYCERKNYTYICSPLDILNLVE
jgi:phosphoglycolate phosphatase